MLDFIGYSVGNSKLILMLPNPVNRTREESERTRVTPKNRRSYLLRLAQEEVVEMWVILHRLKITESELKRRLTGQALTQLASNIYKPMFRNNKGIILRQT